MSLRSRRAAAPVSSSASTTILPATMWRPPANRSVVATSAFRQQVLVIWVLASSAFTCAVIAMPRILPRTSITLAGSRPPRSTRRDQGVVRRRELVGVVPGGSVVGGDVGHDQPRPGRLDDVLKDRPVGDAADVGEHRVHLQGGGVLEQRREVVGLVEA